MLAPTFALTLRRPWTWLVAQGVVRDYVLSIDLGYLVGRPVAIHSDEVGDAECHRQLGRYLQDTELARPTDRDMPKLHLVGVATVVRCAPAPRGGWLVHFENARPIAPVFCPGPGPEFRLWALPAPFAAQLALVLAAQGAPGRNDAGAGRQGA